MPGEVAGTRFYRPGRHGAEVELVEQWNEMRQAIGTGGASRRRWSDDADVVTRWRSPPRSSSRSSSGALVVALLSLASTLRALRAAADLLREETLPLVAELHRAVADTVEEVERVDRIITAAEGIGDRVDGASRLAYRAFGSPVVKAMAFGAGVSQATRRLRGHQGPRRSRRSDRSGAGPMTRGTASRKGA